MKLDLQSILRLLPAVGPVVAALPEFKAVFDQLVATFGDDDQAKLKDAYAALDAENEARHKRLQS